MPDGAQVPSKGVGGKSGTIFMWIPEWCINVEADNKAK